MIEKSNILYDDDIQDITSTPYGLQIRYKSDNGKVFNLNSIPWNAILMAMPPSALCIYDGGENYPDGRAR